MPKCGAICSYGQKQALQAHVWAKNGPKTARNATEFGLARPKQDMMFKTKNTPRLRPRLARNTPFAHLGAPRGCQSVLSSVHMPTTWHLGRMFGPKTARKRPKRGSEDKKRPKQEIMSENQNTPRLARHAPFAHLGAPRACQSVVRSVHTAKTRHSGRMFGRKTARKRRVP